MLWDITVYYVLTGEHVEAVWNHFSESKILQYFGNMKHHTATPDAFAEIRIVINHAELWDAELAWYSLRATQRICLHGLEHGLGINDFRPTWPFLIVEVFSTQVNILEPFGYFDVINYIFTFHAINVFGCFRGAIVQFEIQIKTRWTFISMNFKSHTEWSNAQRESASSMMILPSQLGL